MTNVLAIAQKELRGYFVSPIAYVVVGFFALLYGYFYIASLSFMVQFSAQAGMLGGGPQTININEFMIRPLLANTSIVMMFTLPFLTARAYAEEKRSGTIELLLTSPLTDLQIILGKFLGAMALFTLMLAVTGVHIIILFVYGEPELGPILSGYLGLFLMGASFVSLGLLVSSTTRNQIVAGVVTFSLVLPLLRHGLDGGFGRAGGRRRHARAGDSGAVRRLRAGRDRYRASRLLPQLHRVRPVPDGEVGRQ